jgi:hypothetical protein
MGYKVRVKLVRFVGDVEHFPCRFGYKVGDEFCYDGERFIGRVCPELITSDMGPILGVVGASGVKNYECLVWFYTGLEGADPNMKKYDGIGYKNIRGVPKELLEAIRRGPRPKIAEILSTNFPEVPPYPTKRRAVAEFNCGDPRAFAWFVAEPYDIVDNGFNIPMYNRQMAMLEKLKAEPGMTTEELLQSFTQWEREEINPPLGLAVLGIFLEELETVGYIDMKDGKIYPTAKGKAKSTKKVFADYPVFEKG